jgi:hypothetical protein
MVRDIPLLLRKLLFLVSFGLFALLLGALLGATVFVSHAGHGLAGLGTMLAGALIGLGVGVTSAVIALVRGVRLPWGWLAIGSVIGSALVMGVILLLGALGRW